MNKGGTAFMTPFADESRQRVFFTGENGTGNGFFKEQGPASSAWPVKAHGPADSSREGVCRNRACGIRKRYGPGKEQR